MNRWIYRLMYWFTKPGWDSGVTPPEVVEAFDQGDIPSGAVLDLGCGTGTNVIFMAKHGRRAIGLDFVPEAIRKANQKAKQAGVADRAEFRAADVTRLPDLHLPQIAFALDMGCFHGLSAEGRQRYAKGLAALMPRGARYMLYVLHPRKDSGIAFGMTPAQVRKVLEPYFEVVQQEEGSFWDRGSTWFWMVRKAD
jgi:SAM-dependent methyltransferase